MTARGILRHYFVLSRLTRSAGTIGISLVLAVATTTPALADDASTDSILDDVTVSATKLDLTQSQLTQASSVVTAAGISAQSQTSVTEVLRQLPGIQFQVAGAPGQTLYTRLRGFTDSTTYVFDGVTLNTGGAGDIGYLLGQLDPTMVQNIQVLRGPHATTYGANSTAGVIDFTSLEGDHREEDLSVEGGSLDTWKLRGGIQNSLSVGDGTWKYSLNGSWFDGDGMNPYEFTRNGTLVGRTSFSTGNFEVGGSFYGTINRFQTAAMIESPQFPTLAGGAPAPYFSAQFGDPADFDTTKAGIASLWFKQQLAPGLSQKLTLGVVSQDFSVQDNETPDGGLLGSYPAPYDGWTPDYGYTYYNAGQPVPFYKSPFTSKTINNNYQADYNLDYHTDRVAAVLGATYLAQYYNGTASYDDPPTTRESQFTRSVYGNASIGWLGNRVHTEVGARLDSYSEWRDKATWSAGLTWDIVPGLALYGNYGTSFTQPTLGQLYDPVYGNKAVTPENAGTAEGGIRARQLDGALTETVTYWHSYVSNVITFDYSTPNNRCGYSDYCGIYANANAERSQGVEAEFAWKITPHLTLNGNYTRTDAYFNTAGIWAYQIENARNMGNLGISWSDPRFDAGANLYMTDHRLRWAGDFWAPGYARLDLSGRWHVTRDFDLYGRIQNALDKDIVEVLGYRNPGVYFIVGAGIKLH